MTKKQIDTELISTDNFGIHKVNVGIYGVRLIIGYLGIFIALISNLSVTLPGNFFSGSRVLFVPFST